MKTKRIFAFLLCLVLALSLLPWEAVPVRAATGGGTEADPYIVGSWNDLYNLLQNGGYIIDTPGLKEFGLIQYSKEEIRDYFPEIRQYNNSCRFDNCLHVHEPDCAVIKAVEAGKIPASRYANYLALLQDKDIQIEDWKLR